MQKSIFLQVLSNRMAFFLAGFAPAVWAVMIPYVKDKFFLDESKLGMLLLCLGIGSVLAMPVCGYFGNRFGVKKVIYLCACILAIMLLAIAFSPNIYFVIFALLCLGFGLLVLEVNANLNGGALETIHNIHIMSGLHAFYSIGAFCGAFFCSTLLGLNLSLTFSVVLSVIVLVLALFIFCKHLLVRYDDEKTETSQHRIKIHPVILLIGCLCFVMYLVEGSMLDWSAVFLYQEKSFAIENAGYGFVAFNSSMIVGRLFGDKIVSFLGRSYTLLIGALIIFAGFLILFLSKDSPFLLLGFAVIGIGASNIVPQLISYAAIRKEMPMHQSMTVINAIGYLGILSGPAIIGFISSGIGLSSTFMILSFFVIMVGIISFLLLKTKY